MRTTMRDAEMPRRKQIEQQSENEILRGGEEENKNERRRDCENGGEEI